MAIGKVIRSGEPVSDASGERPASSVSRPGRGVVDAAVFEAHQNAQGIVEAAQRKAQEIVENAERSRARIHAEAREAGRQEGLGQATEVLLRAKMQAGEILTASEHDILELAAKVAEKIIGRDLERDPEVLLEICASAIENVRNVKQMVLRVNPRDAGILRENQKRLMDSIGRSVDVAVKEDNEVASGGCIVQTEFGTIDAQLPTQFAVLRNLLLGDPAKKEGPK